MPDLLFFTFENLILVEKQLYREMKRRLSVLWSRGFAGKTHPLKNACFALFLPFLGLFLPLFSPFWGVRAMRLYGGYGRLAWSRLLKTPIPPQSDRIRPVKARFQAFSISQFHGMSSSMRLIL
jgi:hypothetical protein